MCHELPASSVVDRRKSEGGGGGGGATPDSKPRIRRRGYLYRIATAEYSWPDSGAVGGEKLRALVARLLERDPQKRATVDDIWKDDWMAGNAADEGGGEGAEKTEEQVSGAERTPTPVVAPIARKGARGRPEWAEGEVWVGNITDVARAEERGLHDV
jgi:hypothetical protein